MLEILVEHLRAVEGTCADFAEGTLLATAVKERAALK